MGRDPVPKKDEFLREEDVESGRKNGLGAPSSDPLPFPRTVRVLHGGEVEKDPAPVSRSVTTPFVLKVSRGPGRSSPDLPRLCRRVRRTPPSGVCRPSSLVLS